VIVSASPQSFRDRASGDYDRDKVDEVLGARALALFGAVGAGVSVELLGDALLERHDGQLGRHGGPKHPRAEQHVGGERRRLGDGDVERELLEASSGKLARHRGKVTRGERQLPTTAVAGSPAGSVS
jgi:hypothetical protein